MKSLDLAYRWLNISFSASLRGMQEVLQRKALLSFQRWVGINLFILLYVVKSFIMCQKEGLVKDCVMRISPGGVSLHEYRMYFCSNYFIIFCQKYLNWFLSISFFFILRTFVWLSNKIFAQSSILFWFGKEDGMMQHLKSWLSMIVFLEELVAAQII